MTETVRHPPGPKGLPWVGSMPMLTRDPIAFHGRMSREYGPIAYSKVGPFDLYFLSDPALVDELLNGQAKSCIKDGLTRTLVPLIGHGLLTAEGDAWKRQRKIASLPFAPKRISSYAEPMVRSAEQTFRRFADGEQRDFHHDAMRLALDIASDNLLGVDTEKDADRIAHVIEEILEFYQERITSWRRLLPIDFPTLRQLRFRRAKAELDEIVGRIIAACKRSSSEADHLLARLVKARGDDGQPMSEQLLLDEAITMLLAGHETTALSLMWSAYLLSKNPGVLTRLQAEIDRELGGRAITAADVERLPYLDAVIRETLRLYPPAYAFGREVVTPFELGGYTMPKGAQVVISTYWMHRTPAYFPDPERFVPERWLDGAARNLPRYAYLPFGGGHRVCIGMHFAQLELALLVATMVQQVELFVAPSFTLELQPVITMRSRHGLPVRVRRRRPITSARIPAPADDLDSAARAGCPHASAVHRS